MKIRGITVGTSMKRPDFNQTNPKKSDYIKNNPIPRVTAEDDGKVLLVENGKWTVAEAPYVEVEVTETYDGTVTVDDGASIAFEEDYTEGYNEGYAKGQAEGGGGEVSEETVVEIIEKYLEENPIPKEVQNITSIDTVYDTVDDLPTDKGAGDTFLVLSNQSLYSYNSTAKAWEFKHKLTPHTVYCVLEGDKAGLYRYTMREPPYLVSVESHTLQEAKDYTDKKIKEIGEIGTGAVKEFPYADYDLPVIYFEGDITAMNKDTAVTLNYIYGERSGTCTLKWQGSSSLAYPKKNYTVKFDNAFEAVEGWGEEKKYCLKADWVDFSHCRNVVSAKLWGDVVRSRATSDLVTRLSALPNCGAIDGFPCFVVINGEWQGIFNFNIPKDGWMMGMGIGEKEAILCCEGTGTNDACAFMAEATLGTEFELEYSSDGWAESEIQASLNTLIRAVMNSDGTDIDTTIAQYLDIDSAIDYVVFSNLINHHDGTYKNYILATYDGVKWFFSAYDMDNVFGQHFPGNNFDCASAGLIFTSGHKLFQLLYDFKYDAVCARLNELLNKKHDVIGVGTYDDGIMSSASVTEKFTDYGLKIPLPAYIADAEKWGIIPSTSANNLSQIISWYTQRAMSVNRYYTYLQTSLGTKGLTYAGTGCTGIGRCVETDLVIGRYVNKLYISGVKTDAFKGDTFIETVVIPEGMESLAYQCFMNCTALKKVELPDSLTNIQANVFYGCASLRHFSLPPNLNSLGATAFAGCTKLKKMNFPKTLPRLPKNLFYNTPALTDIYYDGTMAEWEAIEKHEEWNANSGTYTIHCLDGDIAKV